jgi:uncharacterized protein YjbJ (UPF0337 family)
MNKSTASGKRDQMKGKVKQSVGEAVGNERLANAGAADQVKGAAKETWGHTKDAAKAVADSRTGTKGRTEDAAHNLRQGVVNAAQNLKDAVTRHTEKTKHPGRL